MKAIILLLVLFYIAEASSCSCFPHYETKKYTTVQDTWYGMKVQFTCKYSCESKWGSEVVIGAHKKTIIGEERGYETVCDGTIYQESYSTHLGRFIWIYKTSEYFNPKKANSKTLRAWAKLKCD